MCWQSSHGRTLHPQCGTSTVDLVVGPLDCKRSINRALSAGGEFRDACVHVNNVDICDAEQLRGIERIGGWSQA